MKTQTFLTKSVPLLFSFFFFSNSWAAQTNNCVKIDVLSDACQPSSVKADLAGCEDELISVQKVKCKDGTMTVSLRGTESDYRVTLKKSDSGAWGSASWTKTSESLIPHRAVTKTLPKTEHERKDPPTASVEIQSGSTNPNEPKVSSAFLFSAYLDAAYEYNFNRPRPLGAGTNAQNNLRYYNWYTNQLNLNLAELTIKHVRKETSFVMDIDFGHFAELNTQTVGLTASGGPNAGVSNELTKHIGQAVLTYTPASLPGAVFEIGKMPTHVGLELMKSKDNWNYTRSTLFSFGGPFWHTGLHAGYSIVPGVFSVSGYLYNGWGTVTDNNFVPTYGFQAKWTPNDRFTWIYNYIGGPEQINNSENWKQVHESNISFTLTPTVSAAVDFLAGKEKGAAAGGVDALWYGAQAGLKWQTSPAYYISPRIEFYRDSHGYTLGGIGQSLYTYTLTQSYLLTEGLEVRLEGRLDHSDQFDRFTKGTGVSADQPTVLLGILYTM